MPYENYQKMRALVVDDFDSFRSTVTRMLHLMGLYEVDTAFNGEEAIHRCRENNYDLVLCDYNLGQGKNGQQVLEEMRFRKLMTPQSLFVLISAESSKSIVMAAYDFEPDAYLTKPITTKSLQQRLDRLFLQRDDMQEINRALDQGQQAVAITLCQQKIDSGSRYASLCQKLLGRLYLETREYDLAGNLYRQVLEVRQLDWAQVGLAKVKKAQGDYDTANQWLNDIVGSSPLCMQAYDALVESFEEQGNSENVQGVLQKAVSISPLAILRQQRLADVAVENNDLEVAVNAYRRTVKLGENSCYDRIENHLNFGRTSAALCREDEDLAREFVREALRVVGAVGGRFQPDWDEKLQTKFVESQLFAGQGEQQKAEMLLRDAEVEVGGEQAALALATELDFVQALISSGEQKRAKQLLLQLVEKYKNDQLALEKIDRLLDEPLSELNRQRVAQINREGIGFYQKNHYNDAIGKFKLAKRLFPNHIGVQLNLVQALIGEMQQNGGGREMMGLCEGTIKKVEANILPSHQQFNRYRQLRELLKAVVREGS